MDWPVPIWNPQALKVGLTARVVSKGDTDLKRPERRAAKEEQVARGAPKLLDDLCDRDTHSAKPSHRAAATSPSGGGA